jgi:hypothetical protein
MSTPALPSAVAESVGKTLKLWTLHGTVTPSHALTRLNSSTLGMGIPYTSSLYLAADTSRCAGPTVVPLNLTPVEANSDYAATTGDACVRSDWGVVGTAVLRQCSSHRRSARSRR